VNQIFSTNHLGSQGLALGEIFPGQLVFTHSRCSPSKEGSSLLGPSNSHNVFMGLYVDFDQLDNEATPEFTCGNIGVIFLSFSS
jgi:hypothetical protein